jgi:hypothetical protein
MKEETNMMGKWLTAGMIGFVIGMKVKENGKRMCMKRIKKQALKKIGLA